TGEGAGGWDDTDSAQRWSNALPDGTAGQGTALRGAAPNGGAAGLSDADFRGGGADGAVARCYRKTDCTDRGDSGSGGCRNFPGGTGKETRLLSRLSGTAHPQGE